MNLLHMSAGLLASILCNSSCDSENVVMPTMSSTDLYAGLTYQTGLIDNEDFTLCSALK